MNFFFQIRWTLVAVFVCLGILFPPKLFAVYTSDRPGGGNSAVMTGNSAGDTLQFSDFGLNLVHDRWSAGDPGFVDDLDFDTDAGSPGSDPIVSGGQVTVFAGGGSDTIVVISGFLPITYALFGEAGSDLMQGGDGNDVIDGGEGDDGIAGVGGNDIIDGGLGNDSLNGGTGDDIVSGSFGNDEFFWDTNGGSDTIDGGTGFNTMQYQGSNNDDTLTFTPVSGSVVFDTTVGPASLSLSQIQEIRVLNFGGADTINATVLEDTFIDLSGGPGADTLNFDCQGDEVSQTNVTGGILVKPEGGPGILARSDVETINLTNCVPVNLPDGDGDGVPDASDNCPFDLNSTQADLDLDGLGDACDPDADGDGVAGGDNCPAVANSDQSDLDNDTLGDACDPDIDGDGGANGSDNCPRDSNANQANSDGDGLGDACDPILPEDADGDGTPDAEDNCPNLENANQADQDLDGAGDACDADPEGDAVAAGDNCPAVANAEQGDVDDDGLGDACDPDIDGDGIVNGSDNCPATANANQADDDGDGIGNTCESGSALSGGQTSDSGGCSLGGSRRTEGAWLTLFGLLFIPFRRYAFKANN